MRRFRASLPAIAPIMVELTAKPIQPKVIAIPMAVPVAKGKRLPTTANVVGKTGAMVTPDNAASTVARLVLRVRNVRRVVAAMTAGPKEHSKGCNMKEDP